jgi:hypothetical protein
MPLDTRTTADEDTSSYMGDPGWLRGDDYRRETTPAETERSLPMPGLELAGPRIVGWT